MDEFRTKLTAGLHHYGDWSEHDTERLIDKAVALHSEAMKAKDARVAELEATLKEALEVDFASAYVDAREEIVNLCHIRTVAQETAIRLEAENQRLSKELEAVRHHLAYRHGCDNFDSQDPDYGF